eukprot:6307253-Pyramimonas_sp.AAC.1
MNDHEVPTKPLKYACSIRIQEVQLDELKRTATSSGGKPMSFERKQRLHLLLRALPASRAAATAQLLAGAHPGIWSAGRAAVDLDALDPFTLRQLERCVRARPLCYQLGRGVTN